MKLLFVLCGAFLLGLSGAARAEPPAYEMPRTQVISIKESGTDRQYELYIKLPESYSADTEKRFPVIYTTDAVWHFETLYGVTEFLMPDAIIVGISWELNLPDERAHVSRFRDYMVLERETAQVPTGEAANHIEFIRNDVIPLVENTFRTARNERTYFGYSLGGEFGAYALLTHPDTFRNYVIGSPTFGPEGITFERFSELFKSMHSNAQPHDGANVFVTIGQREKAKLDLTHRFVSMLGRNRFSMNVEELEIIEEADHAEAFPETALRGIKWLARLQSRETESTQ